MRMREKESKNRSMNEFGPKQQRPHSESLNGN